MSALGEKAVSLDIKRIITLVVPLLATPAFGFLIAENYLSLGAGDKDLFLLIPWLIWSIIFMIIGATLWRKNIQYKVWVLKAISLSIVIVFILWFILFIISYKKL